jgi:hypothetical protein
MGQEIGTIGGIWVSRAGFRKRGQTEGPNSGGRLYDRDPFGRRGLSSGHEIWKAFQKVPQGRIFGAIYQ